MAHCRLFPKPDRAWLSPSEVVSRLRPRFEHFESDHPGGMEHVDRLVEQLVRLASVAPPPAGPEQIERLRSVRREAIRITALDGTDSEVAYFTTIVIPGEPLFIGFSSPEHETAARRLLERVASALDYEIE